MSRPVFTPRDRWLAVVGLAANLLGLIAASVVIGLPDPWHTQYDVTISCGVFTSAHVYPAALKQLIAMTKPGGVILVSTRTGYYDAEPYQAEQDALIQKGRIKLVKRLLDAPYTVDGKSHYWVYAVL